MKLQGKVAIISGGARGIGRATALLLAQEGAWISLLDLNGQEGPAVCELIQSAQGKAIFTDTDVSSAEQCRTAVNRTIRHFGTIDILINNAGIIRRADILETTEEEWDRVMAVNVKSVFLLSKYAIPHLLASGSGAIVNVASGWGLTGGRKAVSYCASKAAVVNMTRAMALDHGPDNIRVNCVCPGDTDTAMLMDEARQIGQSFDKFRIAAADRPLRKIGKPEDIAKAICYLVSDDAAYITGTALVVDGGGLAG